MLARDVHTFESLRRHGVVSASVGPDDSKISGCGSALRGDVGSESAVPPQVHRFELADCDDVAFGPDGDLYFACHSPQDDLPVKVRGAKSTPDEMDAYVLRLSPRTGKLVFATRIGGKAYDGAWQVSIDQRGHAYISERGGTTTFLPLRPTIALEAIKASSR